MKTKSWKKYMCLMGISLMMMPAVCAMQTAEGGNGDNPVKKTRSTTFISGEKAWEPAGEGVTRQIMGYDGQVMLVKVKFEKGDDRYSSYSLPYPNHLCGKWKV